MRSFRSFDEARDALWGRIEDPAYRRRLAWLRAFSERLCRPRVPGGVRRYRSLDDAQRDREAWEGPETGRRSG